jgi:hypothetical protein
MVVAVPASSKNHQPIANLITILASLSGWKLTELLNGQYQLTAKDSTIVTSKELATICKQLSDNNANILKLSGCNTSGAFTNPITITFRIYLYSTSKEPHYQSILDHDKNLDRK